MRRTVNFTGQDELDADPSMRQGGGKPFKWSLPILVPVAVALCALVAFGALPRFFQNQDLVKSAHDQMSKALSVSVTVAQPGPPIEEFTLPGETQAIQDAPIYARVDGYIGKRFANIGDPVHAGQVLAEIDTPELDQQVQAAASAAEQAAANLDNAREALGKAESDERTAAANTRKANTDLQYYTKEVSRYKQLANVGAVSLEDSDSHEQAYNAGVSTQDAAESAEKSAQSAIRSARAAVHVAEAAMHAAQSQHDQYEVTRSFKKVRALFDGIVTKRNVDAGALVTSGSNTGNTVLFEIAKTNVLRVFVYVPEQYVEDIHVGDHTALEFQEYPGREFMGAVANVAGGIDPASKTLEVEIHVPNQDHKMLPGMYAQVRFKATSQIRLATVPSTAIQTRPDGLFMYTVDRQDRVHLHKIAIGRDLGGQLEISKGIAAGDRVILSPSDDIQDGLLVNPVMVATAAKID